MCEKIFLNPNISFRLRNLNIISCNLMYYYCFILFKAIQSSTIEFNLNRSTSSHQTSRQNRHLLSMLFERIQTRFSWNFTIYIYLSVSLSLFHAYYSNSDKISNIGFFNGQNIFDLEVQVTLGTNNSIGFGSVAIEQTTTNLFNCCHRLC